MNQLLPLMRREWMQHRFGWALLAGVPFLLALVLTSVGSIQIDSDQIDKAGAFFPTLLALGGIVGTMVLLFALMWLSSMVIASGLPRRDNGDRSIEFWLSLPIGHGKSLGVPLLVHLILAPAVAIVVGLLGGYLLSWVLVTRLVGAGVWAGLPWPSLVAGSIAAMLRLLAGLPLATLWLAPLILVVMLMTAWFGRWGWVILTVALPVGGWLLKSVFGHPMISDVTLQLLRHAGQSLLHGGGDSMTARNPGEAQAMLDVMPSWALEDFGRALLDLASPLLLGGLLFSAACFALLVQWRARGAAAGS